MRQKSGRANAIARAMALKDESTNGADVRASARGHQPYRARPLTIGDLMALEPALRRHQGLYELLPNNVLADIEGAHRADKRTTELVNLARVVLDVVLARRSLGIYSRRSLRSLR